MQVVNRGEIVGELTDEQPDMWYLEGCFTPATSAAGKRFAAAAAGLDPNHGIADPKCGIRTSLRDGPNSDDTVFVVMSLKDGRMFGRRVFDREAVDWAMKNVPQ